MKMRYLLWFEIIYICLFNLARDFLHVPASLIYLTDLMTVAAFTVSLLNIRKMNKMATAVNLLMYGMMLYSFTIFMAEGYSVSLFINSFRYKFLAYLFFNACCTYFESGDVALFYKFWNTLFFVNVAVIAAEFRMGYHGDSLGGTFGILKGGNGSILIMLTTVSTIYILKYMHNEVTLQKMAGILLICVIIMAISELKGYIVMTSIVVVLAMLLNGVSLKRIILLLVIGLGILLGIVVMGMVFAGSGLDFYLTGRIFTYIGNSGYTGTGDLNRFNAVIKIYEMFFQNDLWRQLFGFGTGYCYYGSAFIQEYSYLHYQWMADALVYIEGGLVGLLLYEGVFVSLAINYYRLMKKCSHHPVYKEVAQIGIIMSVCAIAMSIYDVTMLEKGGLLMYFTLALPMMRRREQVKVRPYFTKKVRKKRTQWQTI